MAGMTSYGIVYDLKISPYREYRNGFIFYFSSPSHREKFMKEVRKREDWLNDSLSRRFKIEMHVNVLADIQLYRQIETRGFYIINELGEEFGESWQIRLDGMLTSAESYNQQLQAIIEQ